MSPASDAKSMEFICIHFVQDKLCTKSCWCDTGARKYSKHLQGGLCVSVVCAVMQRKGITQGITNNGVVDLKVTVSTNFRCTRVLNVDLDNQGNFIRFTFLTILNVH